MGVVSSGQANLVGGKRILSKAKGVIRMDARLRIVKGPSTGEILAIPLGKLIVGREEDCHLRPASEFISRHHCVFLLDSYALRVRDLGSKNGTFVNGGRIASGEIALSNDDMVSIGELVFQIELEGATLESPRVPSEEVPAALLGTGIVDGETLRDQVPKAPSAPTRSMAANPALSPQDAGVNAPHKNDG